MSHKLETNSARFFYNGDYSGTVMIQTADQNGIMKSMEIEAEDLLRFAGEFIRNKKIQELESANALDLLTG